MAVTIFSATGNTGTLSSAGVGSGLNVSSLVSQLMAVEQQPLNLLNTQEASYQAQLSSLGSVSGAVSAVQRAAQALVTASTASYAASLSDTTVASATADSTAVAGSYALAVTNLAQTQKLIATGQASTSTAIGTGASTTLSFQLGTISGGSLANGVYTGASFAADPTKTPVSVTIDSTNNTLQGIRDAINAANTGFTATIVNDGSATPYRLSLTSNATGATSSLQLKVSGDATIGSLLAYDPTATQNLSQTQAAQNAQFTVDGTAITAASNTVTGAIQGVTLNLTRASPNPSPATATLTVTRDSSKLSAALNGLVQAYNSANSTIAGVTAKGATLQGDWFVLNLQTQIRDILGSIQSSGNYTSLSALGVSFQKDGSLLLDSTKLNAALSSNLSGVASLTNTIGGAIDGAANSILGVGGTIANETDGINNSIAYLDARRTDMQNHLTVIQQQYQQQFSALDTLLGSMNATSSFLTQQLSNLPNYYNSKG